MDTFFAMAGGAAAAGGLIGASELHMPGSPESSNGGNGDMDNEATRTMIMNLLEADAGIEPGGIDQGSLPFPVWPPNRP